MATATFLIDVIARQIGTQAVWEKVKQNIFGVDQAARAAEPTLQRYARAVVGVGAAYLSLNRAVGAVGGILRIGAEMESNRKQLESLTGSAVTAGLAFDWIQRFPAKIDGFTKAFVALQSFGLNPMDGTLKAINDQTAKLGGGQETLMAIVLQIGQAWQKQKLQMEDSLILMERGVPVFDLLSKATGKTVAELRKMSEAGQLDRTIIRQLIEAMGAGAAGAAERRLDTFAGQLDTLRAQAVQFIAAIGNAGLINAATTALRGLLQEINALATSGRLSAIAQGVSDALSKIIAALAALARQAIRSLAGALESGRMQNAAQVISAGLLLVRDALRKVTEHFGLLATAAKVAGIAFVSLKWTALITGVVTATLVVMRLAFALRSLGFAALVTGFHNTTAAILRFVSVIPGVSAVLAFARTALLGYALVFGVVGVAVTAFIVLTERFISRELAAAAAIRQQVVEMGRRRDVTRQLVEIQEQFQKLGMTGLAEQVTGIGTALKNDFITAEEALRRAQVLLQAQTTLSSQLAAERTHLADLEAQKLQQTNEARLEAARSVAASEKESVQATRSRIQEALSAERQYIQEVKRLRQELRQSIVDTENQILEIRRRGMSDTERQASIERQAGLLIAQAYFDILRAAQAKTLEEKKALLETAKARAKESGQLANQVTNLREAESIAFHAGLTTKKALEAEIKLNKDAASAQRQKAEALEAQIRLAESRLAHLQGVIDELKKPVEVDIDADIEKAQRAIDKLQVQLSRLQRGIVVPIGTSGGGESAPGFARGGRIPGFGGGDRIRALLEPGEFVMNKQAARRYGPFLEALNRATLAPGAARAGSGYQSGGAVLDEVNINLAVGPRRVQVRGSRQTARDLADALLDLERAL